MVKKILLAVFLFIAIMNASSVFADEVSSGALRIEQIQSQMPNITAYFYSDNSPSEEDITLEIAGEVLIPTSFKSGALSDAVHHYFLVDCSTSTTQAQLDAVKIAIDHFADNMGEHDLATVISFGVEVKTAIASSNDSQAIKDAVALLEANEAGTVFFDALAEVSALAAVAPLANERKLLWVFSDSVDYNLGGFTQEETRSLLLDAGLPLYAFGFDSGTKENLDSFGALARTTGGEITVVNETTLQQSFSETLNSINNEVYVATFEARSNVIPVAGTTVRFSLGEVVGEFTPSFKFNIPDIIAPQILSVLQTGELTISVQFSEPVQGANVRDNYVLSYPDGSLASISAAAYDDETLVTTLTLDGGVEGGEVQLFCDNISDISQAKNVVDNAIAFSLTITAPSLPDSADSLSSGQSEGAPLGAWIVLIVLFALIVVAIAVASIKRRERAKAMMASTDNADESFTAVEIRNDLAGQDTGRAHFQQAPTKNITLEVSNSAGASKQVTLPINKTMFVGRSDICNVTFDDPRMSRQHFVIEDTANGFCISNLSEGGRTFLNGVPIDGKRQLSHGDKIEAGSHSIVFKTR